MYILWNKLVTIRINRYLSYKFEKQRQALSLFKEVATNLLCRFSQNGVAGNFPDKTAMPGLPCCL